MLGGARLLTGSYAPAYAGADGPIFSRGAMLTAAIAKASGRAADRRRQAVARGGAGARDRLGVPSRSLLVIGDDVQMDVALGRWPAR